MTDDTMTALRDDDELEDALRQPLAVLYKHSPLCGLSAMAAREVRAFSDSNPDVPVYIVDVIRDRGIAMAVERRLAVRHESPQSFVLRAGRVDWHGSHRSVTAEALERAIA